MTLRQFVLPAFALLIVAGISTNADARAKAISRAKIRIDQQTFKVIRYDNGSVKVVQTAVLGDAVSFNLRDRMRRAAEQSTGCKLTDDFWLDASLIGTLVCDQKQAMAI